MKLPTPAQARKAIIALLSAIGVLASTIQLHGTAEAVVNGLLAFGAAFGVYQVRNAPLAAPPAAPVL